MKNPIPLLRKIGFLEGLSFIVLLGIAMPLKWIWGMPMAVKIVGMAHGVLFVAYCAVLLYATIKVRWPMTFAAKLFIAAFLPFGPFLMDRRMKAYETQVTDGKTISSQESSVVR